MPTGPSSAGIWSRLSNKLRGANWQARYEYPEAHRQPRSSRNNDTTAASGGVLDPEELLPPPPLHHQSSYHDRFVSVAKVIFWTAVHAGAIYLFVAHIKPRFLRYIYSIDYYGDDDEDDTSPIWKRYSKYKKRLCCCCDEKVSSKDNFCPQCGAPTCPLCVYCGAGIQNNDRFCKSCGQAVANHVVMDGGGVGRPPAMAPMTRRGSSSSSTSYNNFNHNPHMSPLQNRAVLAPPPQPFQTPQQPPPKEDAVYFATVESVPIVQAENAVLPSMVPLVYAEEVTAATTLPTMNGDSVPAQQVMGEEIAQDGSYRQEHDQEQQQVNDNGYTSQEQDQPDSEADENHTIVARDIAQGQDPEYQRYQEEKCLIPYDKLMVAKHFDDLQTELVFRGCPADAVQTWNFNTRKAKLKELEVERVRATTTAGDLATAFKAFCPLSHAAFRMMGEVDGLIPYSRLTMAKHMEDLETELVFRGCPMTQVQNWSFAARLTRLKELELERAHDDSKAKLAASKAFDPLSTAAFQIGEQG